MGRASFVAELNQAKSLVRYVEAKSFSTLNYFLTLITQALVVQIAEEPLSSEFDTNNFAN